jgi:hypothetical protein
MVRLINDQNKVVFLAESGLYGVASGAAGVGLWIGQVESHTIDDVENKMATRFVGASTRSFTQMIPGPRDVTGTLTYAPQDMRLPFLAIGSIIDGGAAAKYTHVVTQIETNSRQSVFTSGTLNPPTSFTIEDSKTGNGANNTFIRTVNGCVADSMRVIAAQGEKVKVEIDYIGQTLNFTSGTASTTTVSTVTPYLWNNCSLTISGTPIQTAKEVTLEVAQNIEAPHYLNGSRDISVPFPKNRDNKLSVTLDLDAPTSSLLYNGLFKNNAQFNAVFDLNADVTATGSQHTIYFLSGARIISMDAPSEVEGVSESTLELQCPIIVGSAFDATPKYNYW